MRLAPEDGPEDQHPFTDTCIICVFHVDVIHGVPGALTVPVPISFLWVRNFRLDRSFNGGFARKRLHRVEFVLDSDRPTSRCLAPLSSDPTSILSFTYFITQCLPARP